MHAIPNLKSLSVMYYESSFIRIATYKVQFDSTNKSINKTQICLELILTIIYNIFVMCSKSPYVSHDTDDQTEFSKLIIEIRKEFETPGEVNVERVKTILSAYKSNPKDWEKYTTWDPHRYTRNLVDEGNGRYNMMVLCWGESQVSPVHNHPNSNCLVKLLSGVMQETLFALPSSESNKKLQIMKEVQIKRDDVTYIHDSIGLHAMENPSHSEGAVTLHLYVPPFIDCSVYDIRTGKASTCSMTFTTKGGVQVTQ